VFLKKCGESDSECSSSMFRSFENKEFTFVNDCFQNKKKEEIGHYGWTLFKSNAGNTYLTISTQKQPKKFYLCKPKPKYANTNYSQ